MSQSPKPALRCYIAGPMRGIPLFNFPAFDAAKAYLAEHWGFIPVSPADLDRGAGFDPSTLPADYDWQDLQKIGFSLQDAIDRDVAELKTCEVICMLEGWQNSKGAKAEKAIAEWMGRTVLYFHDGAVQFEPKPVPVPAVPPTPILDVAKAITGGDRQASYGPPDQDFRRTAGMWTALFSDLLKPGASFEPFHVAMAMVQLKCSRRMHSPKRDHWIDIAGYAHCGDVCDEAAQNHDTQIRA